jgi:hypothetical protein
MRTAATKSPCCSGLQLLAVEKAASASLETAKASDQAIGIQRAPTRASANANQLEP